MKIEQIIGEDSLYGFTSLTIKLNDTEVFSVQDGEPEDNTLSRNFNDCYSIIDLMRQAHQAGLKGEALHVTETVAKS